MSPIECDKWSNEMKKKEQANAKAASVLQCALSLDQLYKVGSYKSVIELQEKIFELHEGTWDSKIAKCDLLAAQIQSFQMKEVKRVSQMHGRFKEIINGLHGIVEHIENHDLNIIRYTLKVFPHITLYAPMVDTYKISFDC